MWAELDTDQYVTWDRPGRPGLGNAGGVFTVIRRVPNERMVGPDHYMTNMKWTQYFTTEGHA